MIYHTSEISSTRDKTEQKRSTIHSTQRCVTYDVMTGGDALSEESHMDVLHAFCRENTCKRIKSDYDIQHT